MATSASRTSTSARRLVFSPSLRPMPMLVVVITWRPATPNGLRAVRQELAGDGPAGQSRGLGDELVGVEVHQ